MDADFGALVEFSLHCSNNWQKNKGIRVGA